MNLMDEWPKLTEQQKANVSTSAMPMIIGYCSVSNDLGTEGRLAREILEFIGHLIILEKASEQ